MIEYFGMYADKSILVAKVVGLSILSYVAILLLRYLFLKSFASKINKTDTKIDDLLLDLIKNIKKYLIASLSLYIGLGQVEFASNIRHNIDKVIILIIIFQIAQLAGLVINFIINNHLKSKADDDMEVASTINLLSLALKIVIYSIIFLVALNNLGVDITALIAGLGIGGIAVALALQNVLTDLFSSLTIVLDKPFIVGDFIVINDFSGTIENIGIKTTRLKSISGEQLIFGNTDLLQSRIKNYKRMSERRVLQNLTVTYQTTVEQLEVIPEIIKEIVSNQNNVRFDRCHFFRFKESSLEFELVYWILSPEFNDYADCAQNINLKILKEFIKNKIEFAHPTQTIFVSRKDNTFV